MNQITGIMFFCRRWLVHVNPFSRPCIVYVSSIVVARSVAAMSSSFCFWLRNCLSPIVLLFFQRCFYKLALRFLFIDHLRDIFGER